MEYNDELLHELSLLREAIERIADALEGIDEKLDDLIEVEDYDYSEMAELLGLDEEEDFDEDEDDDFDEDEEELHDLHPFKSKRIEKTTAQFRRLFLCRVTDSNCGPFNFQSNALPTELTRREKRFYSFVGWLSSESH